MSTAYLLERAWVGGAVRDDVLVEIEGTLITSVTPASQFRHFSAVAMAEKRGNRRLTGDSYTTLPGLTLPGFANTHSHAFHRALRGRTQRERGTFWTWRAQMYDVANRLDPDSYYALARATYTEMVAAGYTSVGEFHYLHHQPDGTPYDDPNVMGQALVAAARDAGIRIALLDTCYLAGGFGEALSEEQRRFGDADVDGWAERASRRPAAGADVVLGAAVHSVRAVPQKALGAVAAWAADRQVPLHVHLSEQVAENEGCLASYGMSPTALLAEQGVLGPSTTAVHATHLTDADVAALAGSGTTVSLCPTTERDLGDGIGPARRLADAGVALSLGSDSHAVVDPFEEMRAVEMDERLAAQARGRLTAAQLLTTATAHATLGFADAGEIAVGHRADLVTVDTRTPRTAGTGADEHTAVFAATAADVRHVLVDGRVVFDGDHAAVGRQLDETVGRLWR